MGGKGGVCGPRNLAWSLAKGLHGQKSQFAKANLHLNW